MFTPELTDICNDEMNWFDRQGQVRMAVLTFARLSQDCPVGQSSVAVSRCRLHGYETSPPMRHRYSKPVSLSYYFLPLTDGLVGCARAIWVRLVVSNPRCKPKEPQFWDRCGGLEQQSESDANEFRFFSSHRHPGCRVW